MTNGFDTKVYREQSHPLVKSIEWGNDVTDKFTTTYLITPRRPSILIMLTMRMTSLFISCLLTASAYYVAADKVEFFVYYSHWSLFMLTIYFAVATVICFWSRQRRPQEPVNTYKLPWFIQLQWIFFNVACSCNLLTSLIYYLVLLVNKNNNNNLASPINNVIHLFNSLLVFVEVFISSIPIRLRNMYQCLLFTLLYGCFLVVYNKQTGEPVYRFLNWANQKEMFELCVCSIIMLAAAYVVLYTINVIKTKIIKTII